MRSDKDQVPGAQQSDGTVFVGTLPDGRDVFAMPKDIDVTGSFNTAARRIQEMNAQKACGHDDWQVPDANVLHLLRTQQSEGAFVGTFKTTPEFNVQDGRMLNIYWSSTVDPLSADCRRAVHFPSGRETPQPAGCHFSCRPVRLVETQACETTFSGEIDRPVAIYPPLKLLPRSQAG